MTPQEQLSISISKQALQRLPYYLSCLHQMQNEGAATVSAPQIANRLGLHEVQVRKDLAAVSRQQGKPRVGFQLDLLLKDIEAFLGYDDFDHAILVGAGHLGTALLSYSGFSECGLKIVAAFDVSPSIIGQEIHGVPVLPMEKLPGLCYRMGIHIGILTVPGAVAQQVCDLLVADGVLAIWNFTPIHLSVPSNVLLQNENLLSSVAMLRSRLAQQNHPRP